MNVLGNRGPSSGADADGICCPGLSELDGAGYYVSLPALAGSVWFYSLWQKKPAKEVSGSVIRPLAIVELFQS